MAPRDRLVHLLTETAELEHNLPNLPSGCHPAGFVIRLAPLTKATLDHSSS